MFLAGQDAVLHTYCGVSAVNSVFLTANTSSPGQPATGVYIVFSKIKARLLKFQLQYLAFITIRGEQKDMQLDVRDLHEVNNNNSALATSKQLWLYYEMSKKEEDWFNTKTDLK